MSKPIKTMLVYIDGTEQAVTAAQYAICLASFTDADLIAQYVINTGAVQDLLRTYNQRAVANTINNNTLPIVM